MSAAVLRRPLPFRFPLLPLSLLLLSLTIGCRTTGGRPLRVTFPDVGQGDAIVIESPTGRVVVVDAGGHPGADPTAGMDPGSRVIVPYLRRRGISGVDLIVPTHPDDDHVQGLIAVVERTRVRAMLDSGFFRNGASYRVLRETVQRRKIPIYTARRGQRLDIGGGAVLEVLHPGDRPILGTASPTNENSIVLRVVYGRARVLLTGDAAEAAEDAMRASCPDLSADLLKAGHHGSAHSTTAAFLDRVRPRIAIVSCGRNNLYGHPSPAVLKRLADRNIAVYRTDRDGAIVAETDGRLWTVRPTR